MEKNLTLSPHIIKLCFDILFLLILVVVMIWLFKKEVLVKLNTEEKWHKKRLFGDAADAV